MPSVRLDTTIADLYRDHGIPGPFLASTHAVFAYVDLHPEFPRETVFPDDEEPAPYGTDDEEVTALRHTYLSLKPVKRSFALGNMDILLFTPAIEDTARVFDELPPEQRPNPCYVDLSQGNVSDRLRQLGKGKKILYWSPQGWMLKQDCVIDPHLLYQMNSKEYLITSGMRTPQSEMIDLVAEKLHESVLASKSTPFVVKLPLATSGYGTWIVTNEARRQTMLTALSKFKARGGKRIMMSEYINLKLDLSAHLVIGAPGDKNDKYNPLFVAVSVQNLTESGHWTGGTINYSAQAELKELLKDSVRQSTRLLPDAFVGWVGLDIVIDDKGEQWVVDLNPRFTGSVPMCLLSNHFYTQRGLAWAEFGALPYRGATEDLYTLISSELQTGRVVVNAATSVGEGSNLADLVWGATDREDLFTTLDTIQRKLDRTLS